MTWRPRAVAAARAVNGVFFLALAAYCFLSYSPFAYGQFIKPGVVPALTDFVAVSPWLFWVILLLTTLTMMPQLRGARGCFVTRAYVLVGVLIGVAVLIRPPLATLGATRRAFVVGLLLLVSPIWLAVADHVAWRAPDIRPSDRVRVLVVCGVTALMAWAIYALSVPLRLGQTLGIELPVRAMTVALGSSLIVDLFAFMALFLLMITLAGVGAWLRSTASSEYWLFVLLLGACATAVMYDLVCASVGFRGRDAWVASAAFGLTVASVWADVVRLRAQGAEGRDTLAVFSAAVAGSASPKSCLFLLGLLPFVAHTLASSVAQLDWIPLQKVTVLIVWLITFALVNGLLLRRRLEHVRPWPLVVVPLVVLALYQADGWFERRLATPIGMADGSGLSRRAALDRYAALDPSFRLIHDANSGQSPDTAAYYSYLHANTLWMPRDVQPPHTDFVRSIRPADGRKPDIFLIIIDSMRRDYLSPYNPAVTFTPEIGALAADSFVFERAFSRYAGTGLAVASIWAGGMVGHMLDQPAFAQRNTLLKLLDANGYVRMMDMDSVVRELVPRDARLEELDRGRGTMDFDLCRTVDELATAGLARRDASPTFFYALPQNVHIAVASRRPVPTGESYPGFFDRVASSLHRVDGCVGRFVDMLKRTGQYDNSIIILTADHGDSLGEEGRWGHAYFLYPEVMRIPLIVHLPPSLRKQVRTDLNAVSFSTDITPSLYALLGAVPEDLGPLFGRPLFVSPETDSSWRRSGRFVLASTYGAVFAMLRGNGRQIYVADAEDGRDYAFDMSDGLLGHRLDITPATTSANRALIREQLDRLAALYHVTTAAVR